MTTAFNKTLKCLALILTAATATPALVPSIAVGQEARADFDPGRYRINIAGRQRMLTQRMAKSVCFIHEEHNIDMHLKLLADDHALFSSTLDIMTNGGGEHNLAPETDRRTLEELGHVAEQWRNLGEVILRSVNTGTATEADAKYVNSHDLELLEDSDHAVSLIEQNYANPNTLNMATAITLNIFGRQRMLAQRAAKGFCYVAADHAGENEIASLEETRNIFTVSLDAIRFGLPELGIAPPPTDEISAQLAIVADVWKGMDEIFISTIAGVPPTEEDITFSSTTLTMHKLGTTSVVSNELLEDSAAFGTNIEEFIRMDIARAFGAAFDDGALHGNATIRKFGLLIKEELHIIKTEFYLGWLEYSIFISALGTKLFKTF